MTLQWEFHWSFKTQLNDHNGRLVNTQCSYSFIELGNTQYLQNTGPISLDIKSFH